MKKQLSKVKERKLVKIICINCGQGLKRRLSSLGIYDGTNVEIIKNDERGPIILKVFDSKIALGRGQAMKILIEEVN
ncbi:ferrous iron transport protein A [Candidatus Woesearchaeota archaeon]|nr:ferrous iron transport protein A [Candidatus Woesearchaeota archaeon]